MPYLCMRHDFRAPAFGPASTRDIYAAALEQYEWADKHGFDLLVLSEHHCIDDGWQPAPLTMAGVVLGRTKRARVMVSAAMEDAQSQLAQNMKGALYNSVFYYASLLTHKLPIKAADQVVVETPFLPTPLPPQATPTLRVVAPPTDETLFSDRFEDPAASQQNWHLVSGVWTFDNGRMSCKADPVSCEALVGDPSWQNYTFTVDMQGVEGVDKLVYFGVVDGKKTYLIKIRSDPANELVFVEQKAGKPDREIKKVPFKNYNRVPYRVSVTVKGKNLQVSIDSLKLMDVTDNLSDLTGQVGVGLLPATGEGALVASIWFDNVEVVPVK